MKNIAVSTDVYARLWQLRQDNEDTEDEILYRILECSTSPSAAHNKPVNGRAKGIAHTDPTYGVIFEEGFEIFRNGRKYKCRAVVTNGKWLRLDNKKLYNTINQLSNSLGIRSENVWVNWYYKAGVGKKKIEYLKPSGKISEKVRQEILKDLGLE